MPLLPGQQVLVIPLNRRGEIVEARDGSYRVVVGALGMTCREDELRPVDAARPGKRTAGRSARGPTAGTADAADEGGTSVLDLHGFTVAEAREAVLRHVDAALRAGHATVEIVHGIGTGKVRAAVLQELSRIAAVREVRPHPTNRGVTLVHL